VNLMESEGNGKLRIAVPTMHPGGLQAAGSGHFGHADCFTVVDVEGSEIVNVEVVTNPPHVQGGCMAPVNLLKQNGVQVIVVGGIGMRPLMGFQQVGISVYSGYGDVATIVKELVAGNLSSTGENDVCGHSRTAH